jgi:hypothetical protein
LRRRGKGSKQGKYDHEDFLKLKIMVKHGQQAMKAIPASG